MIVIKCTHIGLRSIVVLLAKSRCCLFVLSFLPLFPLSFAERHVSSLEQLNQSAMVVGSQPALCFFSKVNYLKKKTVTHAGIS